MTWPEIVCHTVGSCELRGLDEFVEYQFLEEADIPLAVWKATKENEGKKGKMRKRTKRGSNLYEWILFGHTLAGRNLQIVVG